MSENLFENELTLIYVTAGTVMVSRLALQYSREFRGCGLCGFGVRLRGRLAPASIRQRLSHPSPPNRGIRRVFAKRKCLRIQRRRMIESRCGSCFLCADNIV